MKRLERYLALPELHGYVETCPHPDTDSDSPMAKPGSITIQDGTFTWIDPDGPEIKPVQEEKPKKDKTKKKKKKRRDSTKKSDGDDDADDSSESEGLSGSVRSFASTESGSRSGGGLTLQDINCEIEAGSLVAVVGAAAC